ncbi:MAG: hydrogenase iron-sulfur subunit, partial [Betaproteobacteria bacterium]
SLAMLALLALLWPAKSLGPAHTGRVASSLSLDWFYQFVHPLVDASSAATAWWLAAALTVALAALPLLRNRRVRAPARVDLTNCNGCSRCAADCPFAAVVMVARTDQSRDRLQALVRSDLCAACGICVGSCPSSTPFRRIEELVSGIEMPDQPIAALRRELQQKLAALSGEQPIVLFTCGQAADFSSLANASTAVMTLECAAMLPPSFLGYALRMGAAGALVVGCREGDCEFRLGDQWVRERLSGVREPRLQASVPRDRTAVLWSGRDIAGIAATLATLRARWSTVPRPQMNDPLKEAFHD